MKNKLEESNEQKKCKCNREKEFVFFYDVAPKYFTLMTSWQQQLKNYTATKYACRCELQQMMTEQMMTDDCVMECFRFGRKLEQYTYACSFESTVISIIPTESNAPV